MAQSSSASNAWMLPVTGPRRSGAHGAASVRVVGGAQRRRGPRASAAGRSYDVTRKRPESNFESTAMPGWSCSGSAAPFGRRKMPIERSPALCTLSYPTDGPGATGSSATSAGSSASSAAAAPSRSPAEERSKMRCTSAFAPVARARTSDSRPRPAIWWKPPAAASASAMCVGSGGSRGGRWRDDREKLRNSYYLR